MEAPVALEVLIKIEARLLLEDAEAAGVLVALLFVTDLLLNMEVQLLLRCDGADAETVLAAELDDLLKMEVRVALLGGEVLSDVVSRELVAVTVVETGLAGF